MLREGFRVVSNCDCGGEQADTACYSCLCNYYNQRQHDILKRRYAIDFYQQFSASYKNEWEYYRNEEVYQELGNVDVKSKVISNIEEEIAATKEHFQLNFCDEGRNQVSDTVEEIWRNLLDDCNDDERKLIQEIVNQHVENITRPIYGESVVIAETQEKIFVKYGKINK